MCFFFFHEIGEVIEMFGSGNINLVNIPNLYSTADVCDFFELWCRVYVIKPELKTGRFIEISLDTLGRNLVWLILKWQDVWWLDVISV